MGKFIGFWFSVFTAIIGYHIHGGFFWTLCNFVFAPLSWLKWLICDEVTVTIVKGAFSHFFQ